MTDKIAIAETQHFDFVTEEKAYANHYFYTKIS